MSLSEEKRVVDKWGRVLIKADDLFELLYKEVDPETLHVVGDEQINEYNRWCKFFNKKQFLIKPIADLECTPEEEHARRASEWFIPDEYKKLNVRETLLDRCDRDDERHRINAEMDMFEERGLVPLLQLMFALVDYFRSENIVWGVGRGSSCASYCLYLIGVHKIDSIRFGLDIREFLK